MLADALAKEGARLKTFGQINYFVVPPMYDAKSTWENIIGASFI